ncbi:hypothetical protein Tco_1148750 [Tanacetum coccineum]
MLTSRKRNGPLPNHRLALRYSESHSSSDHFSPDDSSSGFSSDSSDTSSSHSLSDSSFDILVKGRIRGSVSTTDYEVSLEESYKTNTEPDIDSDVQADIDACITAVDSVTTRETDVRVEFGIETKDEAEEEAESSARGTIEIGMDKVIEPVVADDIAEPIERIFLILSVHPERTKPTATRSGMAQDATDELIAKRVAEALKAYDGNGNGNPNVNTGGIVPVAGECTYQDFMKCQPLNFKGTEGVVGLTRWFEKIETVFHISNCPQKYQVKTVGTDAAYAMTWKALMKLMTEMVLEEEDQVKKFIGGLPDNIQGSVIAVKPTRLQDAFRITNNLMDQKLKGYVARNAENKRRFDNNSRDNRVQQPPFKRQNRNGQNVSRAYNVGNNEKRRYAGPLPYHNKSFVSSTFSVVLDIIPSTLDESYAVELADERIVETNTLLRGCTYHAVIISVVEVYVISVWNDVFGDQGYGCSVTERKAEDKSEEKRLEDVPIIRDFPKHDPRYGLAPSELQELSDQLRKFLTKDYTQSSHPRELRFLFVKKENAFFSDGVSDLSVSKQMAYSEDPISTSDNDNSDDQFARIKCILKIDLRFGYSPTQSLREVESHKDGV